jgi:hypothetical protein
MADLLLLEVSDLLLNLGERQLQVGGRRLAGALLGHHGANLGQGEAKLLALQNHGEARPVASVVDAGRTLATGRQKAAILIKPESTQRHAELTGKIADRVGLRAVRATRGSGFLSRKKLFFRIDIHCAHHFCWPGHWPGF